MISCNVKKMFDTLVTDMKIKTSLIMLYVCFLERMQSIGQWWFMLISPSQPIHFE